MTFDLQRILESKRAYRQAVAARPIAEKLRMLDALRERAVTLRAAAACGTTPPSVARENPARYGIPHGEAENK